MVNQQLLDYVKQQFQLGVAKDVVKSTLSSSGWPEADIEEAFRTVGGGGAAAVTASQPASGTPVTSDIFQPKDSGATERKTLNVFSKSTTASPVTTTDPSNKPSFIKRFWKSGVMVLVLLGLLGAIVYLYNAKASLEKEVANGSQSNGTLSQQNTALAEERAKLTAEMNTLKDAKVDADLHLDLLIPPATGSSTAKSFNLKGSLKGDDKTPYTLTTSRGLLVTVKNYKDPRVAAALKPLAGKDVQLGGTSVPGSRELIITSVNGSPLPELTSASSTVTTAPKTTENSTSEKTLIP